MNTNELPIGTVTETMNMGFRVPVEIIGRNTIVHGVGNEALFYEVRYLGERKCLDIGQNWYIEKGDVFKTRPVNIDRAAEWKAQGY